MRASVLVVALLAVTTGPQVAMAKKPARVMVLDIPRDDAFKPNVIQAINEFLTGAIRDQGFDVVSSSDIAATLGAERQRQLLGCAESSCMAELGGALGAAYVVHGTLAVLDADSALTLSLVDEKGKAVNQVRKLVKGKSADILIPAIEDLVPRLMAPIKAAPVETPATGSVAAAPPKTAEPAAGGVVSSQQEGKSEGSSHVAAYALLGVGAVGLVGSAVFGILANSAQSNVNADAKNGLYNTGNTSTLKTDAWVSTVALAVGVVAAGTGGALFLFSGSDASPSK